MPAKEFYLNSVGYWELLEEFKQDKKDLHF